MEIIWDNRQFRVTINHIEIQIAPQNLQPFNISATVDEQDTSLVLYPDDEINDPGNDKPVWYLSNTLELQQVHKPGDVIIKHSNPVHFLAVVHDLDLSPSWKSEWIEIALRNILLLSDEKEFSSIRLPVLGAQYGRFSLKEFIELLVMVLIEKKPTIKLKHIWLVIPPKEIQNAFDLLRKNVTIQPQILNKLKKKT